MFSVNEPFSNFLCSGCLCTLKASNLVGYYGNTADLMKTLKISETSGVGGQYFQSHLSFPCLWMTFLVAQMVKRLPAMQETQLQSLGWEISWGRKWQPTPVFLPGKSHGRRRLIGYSQSMGLQRVGHDWVTSLHFFIQKPFLPWDTGLDNLGIRRQQKCK